MLNFSSNVFHEIQFVEEYSFPCFNVELKLEIFTKFFEIINDSLII